MWPFSSRVYQSVLTPASTATSSRRRPGTCGRHGESNLLRHDSCPPAGEEVPDLGAVVGFGRHADHSTAGSRPVGVELLPDSRNPSNGHGGAWQAIGMGLFLVTGNPGSGKSAMVGELTRLGQIALDADDAIAGWETQSGLSVEQPEAPPTSGC